MTLAATNSAKRSAGCHRLARWRLALQAFSWAGALAKNRETPPGKPVASEKDSGRISTLAASVKLHRASRWHQSKCYMSALRTPHSALRTLAWLCLLALLSSGCTRAYYRVQADNEVYDLLARGIRDPRWQLDRFAIQVDPRSRFFDPACPDHSPMPPDDPTSHQLMHCVDCKEGWPCWHRNGDTPYTENPAYVQYLPFDEEGNVVLDLEKTIEIAAINSRDYQQNLETLYLSALDVTFERFRFDTQFFGSNSTFFTADGRARAGSGGRSRSVLDIDTNLQARRLFSTGGDLVVNAANSLMWQFAGPDTYTANTLLDFTFIQPLLQFGGRRRVLERLTVSERVLLANIRAMEQYRRSFHLSLAVQGGNGSGGPQRRGGIFGAGLEGFQGVGAGGFGGITGGGGGGGQAGAADAGGLGGGFAGGTGAGNAGGFLGLLQQARVLENSRANVESLRQSLQLLEAFYRANRIDRFQVDQARQASFTTQSQLLQAENNLERSLDAFKTTLGLPPKLPIRLRDDRLDQFELLSPEMIRLQTDAGLMVARLWTVPEDELEQGAMQDGDRSLDDARAQLQRDAQLLDGTLDILKLTQYLVPPGDNPLRALRDRFRVYEARLEQLRQAQMRLDRVMMQLESAPYALELAGPIQDRALGLLPGVESSLEQLEETKDDRVDALKRLAESESVRAGTVDRGAFDVQDFQQRVAGLPGEFAELDRRLNLPRDRWTRWDRDLQQQRATAISLVQRMDELYGPLRPLVERLQQELARPERTALPPELNQLITELNRLVDDERLLEPIERDIVSLESLLNTISLEVGTLSEDASNLGLLQARAKLESSTLVPIDMDADTALGIASRYRLDWMNNRASVVDVWRLIEFNANALEASLDVVFSGDINTLGDNPFRFRSTTGRLRAGLQFDAPITRLAERNLYRQALIEYQQRKRSYVQFIDNVSGTLRNILRQIELNQVNFEMRRAAVRIALDQVELARLRLQEPPRPGVAAAFGSTTARDLISALSDLLAVQNDYLSVWTNYEQQRMVLDFNLGTFQLDERGMWIDPGEIDNDTYGGCDAEPIDAADPSEPPSCSPFRPPATTRRTKRSSRATSRQCSSVRPPAEWSRKGRKACWPASPSRSPARRAGRACLPSPRRPTRQRPSSSCSRRTSRRGWPRISRTRRSPCRR